MKTKESMVVMGLLFLSLVVIAKPAKAEWKTVTTLDQRIGVLDLTYCDYRLVYFSNDYQGGVGSIILSDVKAYENRAESDNSVWFQLLTFTLNPLDVGGLGVMPNLMPNLNGAGTSAYEDIETVLRDFDAKLLSTEINILTKTNQPQYAQAIFSYKAIRRDTPSGQYFGSNYLLDARKFRLEKNCSGKSRR